MNTEVLNEEVAFECVEGGIAVLSINRPAQRNALNRTVLDGLRAGFARFEQDASLRVLILTGSGDKAFCAGMDLKQAAATGLQIPPRSNNLTPSTPERAGWTQQFRPGWQINLGR